jgi:hypothetical protein
MEEGEDGAKNKDLNSSLERKNICSLSAVVSNISAVESLRRLLGYISMKIVTPYTV